MTLGSKRIYIRHVQSHSDYHGISQHQNQQQQRYRHEEQYSIPSWQSKQYSTSIIGRQPQNRLSFNPFPNQDLNNNSDASASTPYPSRLNADSSPFIPFFGQQYRSPAQVSDDPNSFGQYRLDFKTTSTSPSTHSAPTELTHQGSSLSAPEITNKVTSPPSSSSSSRTQLNSGIVNTDEDTQLFDKSIAEPVNGADESNRLGAIGSSIGVTSRMHDRWLKAGMGAGNDKWFKSAAWCEFF